MKPVTKRTKNILLVLGFSLIAIIGGTVAYYMSREEFDNEFYVGEPGVAVEEKFNPGEQWVPGEKKEKEVWFTNTGEIDMLLRFRLDAQWEPGKEPVSASGEEFTPWDLITLNWNVEDSAEESDPEGTDDTKIQYFTKIEESDGVYYYYNKILRRSGIEGSKTDKILEAVTFASDISNGSNGPDYSGAQINLTIYGETVLVDEAAALETWGRQPEIDRETGNVIWQ